MFEPIEPGEIEQLTAAYGRPRWWERDIAADDYLFATRSQKSRDRRGEVVFAIERPAGRFWVHRKSWYESDVYRLLSGGIHWDETVESALYREMEEETGMGFRRASFLGVIDCRMHHPYRSLRFVSYVFHIPEPQGEFLPEDDSEDIVGIRAVPLGDLWSIADQLNALAPPRRGWGEWRALAHEMVYEALK